MYFGWGLAFGGSIWDGGVQDQSGNFLGVTSLAKDFMSIWGLGWGDPPLTSLASLCKLSLEFKLHLPSTH